jgi:aspartyl/glutamyl-tRNA(Asn/Gln) amidotransferase C subunit
MSDISDYEAMTMLDLTEGERQELNGRFDALIRGFKELEKIETNGVVPLVTVLDLNTVLREDVSTKQISREEILANTNWEHDGYFQVPGTLV